MARPRRSFNGFYGQVEVVRRLCRCLRGAQALGALRELVLLIGESGWGKTRLARATADDLGLEFRRLIAFATTKVSELITFLEDAAQAGALAFIDEVQELTPDVQMALVAWIDTFLARTSGPEWKGAFCLVAATDRAQYLVRALQTRMAGQYILRPYGARDLQRIIGAYAAMIQLPITPQGITLVARVSRGSPRSARHLVDGLRKLRARKSLPEIRSPHVRQFLRSEGIDPRGLLPHDRRYLDLLRASPGGLTLRVLAIRLALEQRYVYEVVEPYLIRLELVEVRQGLRCLTVAAQSIKEDAP